MEVIKEDQLCLGQYPTNFGEILWIDVCYCGGRLHELFAREKFDLGTFFLTRLNLLLVIIEISFSVI
jgi:hypothetical protein